jgi:MurNAc alpha-1-phosphate uridylyltransferase
MRGMILAAGRGQRMGDLTATTPKPLLKVHDRYLIEYSILALKKLAITDIIINVCYQATQIQQALGNGQQYGVNIYYSVEDEALETGGGIFAALPLLGDEPFTVVSGDIITDYPFSQLPLQPRGLAHLVLVANPKFHPEGDFNLHNDRVYCSRVNPFTYANIGVYHPDLFINCVKEKFSLGPLLKTAAANEAVSGEIYRGLWHNVGTPGDLAQANLLEFAF